VPDFILVVLGGMTPKFSFSRRREVTFTCTTARALPSSAAMTLCYLGEAVKSVSLSGVETVVVGKTLPEAICFTDGYSF